MAQLLVDVLNHCIVITNRFVRLAPHSLLQLPVVASHTPVRSKGEGLPSSYMPDILQNPKTIGSESDFAVLPNELQAVF